MTIRTTLLRPLYRLYEDRLARGLDSSRLPRHIGVILDGHRRFVRESGLVDYAAGYRMGMDRFVDFLHWCDNFDIPAVTGWLLSKENLQRPTDELRPYFDVLVELFEQLPQTAGHRGWTIRFIGSLDLLPADVVEAAKRCQESTSAGERRLTIALAYGGRQEIVDAVRDLVTGLGKEGLSPEEMALEIDADSIAANLYTTDVPDPDLVIRTSGESRLSGFLLWQSAYSEFSFVDVFWPAFRRVDFLRALRDFTRRERRYGL